MMTGLVTGSINNCYWKASCSPGAGGFLNLLQGYEWASHWEGWFDTYPVMSTFLPDSILAPLLRSCSLPAQLRLAAKR